MTEDLDVTIQIQLGDSTLELTKSEARELNEALTQALCRSRVVRNHNLGFVPTRIDYRELYA